MNCSYSYARDCSECNEPRCPYIEHMDEEGCDD